MEKSIAFDSWQFVYLMFGFAATLVLLWAILWVVIARSKTNPLLIIENTGFLRIVTVGFTLSAVVILSLAHVISGEIAGAVISGVVGYVLGSNRSPRPKKIKKATNDLQKALPNKSLELPPE